MRSLLSTLVLLVSLNMPAAGDGPGAEGDIPFADGVMTAALRKYDAPGSVLVVVKDGRVLLRKGYGLADVDRRTPMDAAATRLPVASISKIVTATAVMQLVEQGRLGLDDDVNKHLRAFQIEATFPEAVRVRHLLTHTAGFDESLSGVVAPSLASTKPLAIHLAARMPPRIAPPGEEWLYSNHGIALAGHIVELVSGEPFAAYMREQLFKPLGMASSSFMVTPEIKARLATGYAGLPGARQRWPLPYTHLLPAAALTTTGDDIARFMLSHLEGGATDSGRILQPETVRLMHTRHFALHPLGAGMAYGFMEQFADGTRALLHDGDWPGYSSRLLLVPEERLGVFVTFNVWSAEARADVVGRIVKRYAAREGTLRSGTAPPPAFEPNAAAVTGVYRTNRYPHAGGLKLMALGSETRITAVDSGTLDVDGARYTAGEPGVFRRVDGIGRLFAIERQGHVAEVILESPVLSGFMVLEPVPWHGTRAFQQTLSLCLRAISASSLFWVVVGGIRFYKRRTSAVEPSTVCARLAALVAAVPVVAGPIWIPALVAALVAGSAGGELFLQVMPLVLATLTVILCYYNVIAWRRKLWSPIGRVHYTIVSASVGVYVCMLAYWDLLQLPF